MVQKTLQIVRYLISGGTAAIVDLGLLFVFVEWLSIYYIIAAIIAFLISFVVSFVLQKYWTFKDARTQDVHKQVSVYFLVALINLGINTLLIYIFVEFFGMHYIFGQILASGLIAISSFFIYSLFIFKHGSFKAINSEQKDNF